MQNPLLQTKLHVPHQRPELVHRSRLIDQLTAAHDGKLILVTAPAGFGKTTLVSSWLARQGRAVAWVSLDESDNDPLRFLLYVVSALNQRAATIGCAALEMLRSPEPPANKTLLAYLINDLAGAQQPMILALDDYHLVHAQEVHDLLTFLLENLPPQLQIVLLSRAAAPLPVARLRSRRQLVELGVADLRFTEHETEIFLNQVMRLGLSSAQVQELDTKTEGWITGLQLIALTIKNAGDANRLLSHIAGDSRYIADYLVDEVLSRQPQQIQQFLLRSSVLERMGARLCNAVLEIEDSQQMLEDLEKANLFVIPLDHTRTWYRYHHLFAELLRHRLAEHDGEQVDELHRRAARWFFDHNMIEDAIGHWLEAGEYATVTDYLQGSINDQMLASGKFRVYLAWLDRIPDTYLVRYPKLVLYRVFQLWEMQNLEKFRQQYRLVEQMLGPTPATADGLDAQTATYHGIFAVIRGVVNCGAYATRPAADCFEQALRLLPEESLFWRSLSLGATGFCYRVEGNYTAAADYFARVIDLAADQGLVFITFMYATAYALVHLSNGQLVSAIDACKIPLSLDARHGYSIPFAGLAYTVMGILLYMSDDLTGAESHTRRGLELVTRDGDAYYIADGYFTLAQIQLARGDVDGALASVAEMDHQIKRLAAPASALIIAHAYQATIWIACQRLAPARQWAANSGAAQLSANHYPDIRGLAYFGIYCTVHESFKPAIDLIRLTEAHFHLAAGDPAHALDLLDALAGEMPQESSVYIKTQFLIVQALAEQKMGEVERAAETALAALRLVAPQPFVQLFVSQGKPMRELLEKARQLVGGSGPVSERDMVVRTLLEQILARMPASPAMTKCNNAPSIYELTPREIEVLVSLAQGISYAEAAARLMVSENTVKTHLKHIYSKLDVTNRLQAVNKAKELHLLM